MNIKKNNILTFAVYTVAIFCLSLPFCKYLYVSIPVSIILGLFFSLLNTIIIQLRILNGEKLFEDTENKDFSIAHQEIKQLKEKLYKKRSLPFSDIDFNYDLTFSKKGREYYGYIINIDQFLSEFKKSEFKKNEKLIFSVNPDNNSIYWNNGTIIISSTKGTIKKWQDDVFKAKTVDENSNSENRYSRAEKEIQEFKQKHNMGDFKNDKPLQYQFTYDVLGQYMIDFNRNKIPFDKLEKDEKMIFCLNADDNSIYWNNQTCVRISSTNGTIEKWVRETFTGTNENDHLKNSNKKCKCKKSKHKK